MPEGHSPACEDHASASGSSMMARRWATGRGTAKEGSDESRLWIEPMKKDRYGFVKTKFLKSARASFMGEKGMCGLVVEWLGGYYGQEGDIVDLL